MSTSKPTIKRIHKEASDLARQPSPDYHAAPLDTDLFEWHFTLRGPPAPSPFAGGIYHGRIVLPPAYPLKPPSFRFLTASGRFEANREICLSISGFHEETWQPAWDIRTALVAIRSFMDTKAEGQVGGMESSDVRRRQLAGESKAYRCKRCERSNEEIMKEQDAAVESLGEGEAREGKEVVVPEELRLVYREELGKEKEKEKGKGEGERKGEESVSTAEEEKGGSRQGEVQRGQTAAATPVVAPAARLQQRQPQVANDGVPEWIDRAIYGVLAMLAFLAWRQFVA